MVFRPFLSHSEADTSRFRDVGIVEDSFIPVVLEAKVKSTLPSTGPEEPDIESELLYPIVTPESCHVLSSFILFSAILG